MKSKLAPVLSVRGVITSVDKTKWTCNVRCQDNTVLEDLPIVPVYVGADGQGISVLPETNSVVYVWKTSEGGPPFIMGSCPLPSQLSAGDDEEDPTSRRMNRPVVNEGDFVLSGERGKPYLIMRKGGVLEIGSNQVTNRTYVPLGRLIRDICQNYELVTTGGHLRLRTRQEDESHGPGNTPVEFDLQIKEFSEGAPLIEIGMGRISDEDGLQQVFGSQGQTIARVLINDRFKLFVDKDGNVDTSIAGASYTNYEGYRQEYHHTTFYQEVRALFRGKFGTRSTEVDGQDVLSVGASRIVKIGGDFTEEVTGNVSRVFGSLSEQSTGEIDRTVAGGLTERFGGPRTASVVGDDKLSTTGEKEQLVTGRYTLSVVNSERDDSGLKVVLVNGEALLHSVFGSTVLSSGAGTGDAAMSRLDLGPTGSVELRSAFNTSRLQADAEGISIGTTPGEVYVDAAGLVHLGSSTAANPNVKGTELVQLLTALLVWADTHTHMTIGGPSSPPSVPSSATLSAMIAKILSTFVFGK